MELEYFSPHALNMQDVYLEALEELAKPFPSVQLPDWKLFNEMTGGFRSREFTILCGSTGSGKTTFLANLSAQLLKNATRHFVMSVETGHTDYMKRIMSVLEGRDMNRGDPVPVEQLTRFHMTHKAAIETRAIEFALYDNRVPVETLIKELDFHVHKRGCKIAFIDNLNFFLEVTKSSEQIVEMDRVIHELILFCKQTDVHVVMVMHPKKASSDKDTRVKSEYEIKGSSTAVQEAHNVFLFNRPRPEDVKNGDRQWTDRELYIAKMRRRGMNVGKTLIFSNQSTRYCEEGFS